MRHYISVQQIEDLPLLINQAIALKKENTAATLGKGKTLGLLFFNSSLRTRLSTEKAGRLLGMDVLTMNVGADGWALEFEDGAIMNVDKAEHIKEAAAVLSQYCDIIGVRAFPTLQDQKKDEEEQVINAFLKYASVPIVNLESSTGHPLQALTDAISIRELSSQGKRPKVVMTWAPHPKALPQSVPNSFAQMMQKMEVDFCIANPEGYDLSKRITGDTKVFHNQTEALKDADFVYVKNWSSYESYGKVLSSDPQWTFSKEKLALTNDARVMHCLPVRRNVVIADEVLDSANSIVIHQANNRTFAAQAVLKRLLEGQD